MNENTSAYKFVVIVVVQKGSSIKYQVFLGGVVGAVGKI